MSFDEDLDGVPLERQAAAKLFLRIDRGAGRLWLLSIAGVLALFSLMCGAFAMLELVTGDSGAAVGSAVAGLCFAVAAVVVATRPRRRFTEMDVG